MLGSANMRADDTVFTLLTTESAVPGSVASLLGVNNKFRDVDAALETMRKIALETDNASNKKAYEAFSALKRWEQESLVSSVYVIGNSPDIIEVETQIRRKIRLSASSRHIDAFTSRLEGLWFKRVIEVMSYDDQHNICIGELLGFIDDLRNQFLPGNLPSDFDDIEPEDLDVENDDRVFVEQLRLIGMTNRAVRIAIINFYRAYEQRSRWSRENLVRPGEIKKYLNKLKEEWEHQSSLVESKHDLSLENEKIATGKEVYAICQDSSALPIRTDFKSAYVARGSYHTLSDNKELGWHPDYIDRLTSANDKKEA